MSANTVVIQGVVKPDGTLELEGKLSLNPGKVQVTIVSIPPEFDEHPFWKIMREIWAGQQARGHVPRSVEEVEAERREFREDWEERLLEFELIRAEAHRLREQHE